MNRAHRQSLFAYGFVLAALSSSGCSTPLPKPPLLTPMPTAGFLLTPPPEKTLPKAIPSCPEPKCP